jgi:hypothetical protein
MAALTPAEFTDAVAALAEHYGVERLRDKLAAVGAFRSRKGLTSAGALAERLYHLSGGLRLPVAATYAFSHLWGEMLAARLGGGEGEKTIESLADQVNACLDPAEQVVAGKEGELDRALAAYRDAIAKATTARVAHYDMLLKAVPAVADRVRAMSPAAP